MGMTIGKKLGLSTILFTLAALVPFGILAFIAVSTARESFIEDRFAQLESVSRIKKAQVEKLFEDRQTDMTILVENVHNLRETAFEKLKVSQDMKKRQVEDYMQKCMTDVSVLAANATLTSALISLSQAFGAEENAIDSDFWKGMANVYGPWLEQYKGGYDYDDLLLINEKGDVVYSVARKSDLGQNLISGELKETPLSKCFEKGLKQAMIQDFEPYAPADSQVAAFVASPVKKGDRLLGVVALRFSAALLNAIVQRREGMGKSGETYLVAEKDGQVSLRSELQTMGDGKYVVGYDITTIKPAYVDAALSGESGYDIFSDSKGNLVMAVYEPLRFQGLNWACISKIDFEEAVALKLSGEEQDFYAKYIDQYGYYDLFLIHPQGKVFYSVTHESDYGTNMIDGEYKDSGLGKLVQRVLETKEFGLADFEPYAPSNGDPAAFIAQPLIHEGEVELIVALQLSIESINHIMGERAGLGKTGETYLVGPDKRMRSDSYLDPQNHSVRASFANPEKGMVDTEASRAALAGKAGHKIVIDYNGNPVLSAYTPVKIGDLTWGLLAEIDQQEVVSESVAAENLFQRVLMIGAASLVVIFVVVLFNIFSIRNLLRSLKQTIQGLNEGSQQVAAAAGQVTASSQQISDGASEQAASIEETSSSLEELAATTKLNAENSDQADLLMKEVNQVADRANVSMKDLGKSMQEISEASEETFKIIKTIDEIAFQTNLLALNAAVEAARAGEAGAGFAVVADEVRNLAMRAADAASNTAELIEGTVKKVHDGADLVIRTNSAFSQVEESAEKAGTLVSEIAGASAEQSRGIGQINTAVTEMDKVVQQNTAVAEENASASEEMHAQAEQMRGYVNGLVALVSGEGKNATKRDHENKDPETGRKSRAALPVSAEAAV